MKKKDLGSRLYQEEIMDDFSLDTKELEQIFRDLESVNGILGGTRITLNGLKKLLATTRKDREITILDVGCGNGAMLRAIAKFGQKKGWNFSLLGIDANPEAIAIAQKQSVDYRNIKYICINVHSEQLLEVEADIILCTLTLHHFKDQEIIRLMNLFIGKASLGIVINDLQRSKMAFHLFKVFSAVFIKNSIAKQDGQVSILRSFRRRDFRNYISHLQHGHHEIKWKWAFRYQWLIYTDKKNIK